MKALSIGATGMLAQQLNVDVISNNIANMTTTGYKRQRAEFQDLLYQNERRVGSQSSSSGTIVPAGVQLGLGVKASAVYRIMEQGPLASTTNKFDIAINGSGYFQVTLPTGETAYTRAGSFQLSPDGTIVTQDGYTVNPGISVPNDARDVSINESGEVFAKIDGQVTPVNLGQLELATFANEGGLEAVGGNLFLETPASGAATPGAPAEPGYGAIMQGFLEQSNVNVVTEITNMITAQRAYEMNSKVISTSEQMMSTTNRMTS